MLTLALPVLAEESLNLLVGYTDWFLAGRFLTGNEPLAAMGLMAYFMWMLPSLFSFISIGALALIARFVGGGDGRLATHTMNQAFRIGGFAAIALIAVILLLSQDFVAAMQLKGRAAELAVRYIWIVAPAIPFIMIEQVGTACLRAAGDTVSGMLARVVVNIVNLVLSTALVTGYGPFPNLGWDGLAIGTACGHAAGGCIILLLLVRGRSGLKLSLLASVGRPFSASKGRPFLASGGRKPPDDSTFDSSTMRFDWPMIRRILRIGVPGAFDVLAVITCHLIYATIINRLGTIAQAAHGLGVQIEALSYLSGSAFQVAAATLAGQALGAGDQRLAMRSALTCAYSAVLTMTSAGVVFYLFGESLAWFFTGEYSATTRLTGELLGIVALACPFHALLMVFTGTLRGSGDTSWPLVSTFIGLVGVRIPLACLLAWDEIPIPFTDAIIPGFGLGVAGAWYAMITDVTVRSLFISGRFLHGGWRRVEV